MKFPFAGIRRLKGIRGRPGRMYEGIGLTALWPTQLSGHDFAFEHNESHHTSSRRHIMIHTGI